MSQKLNIVVFHLKIFSFNIYNNKLFDKLLYGYRSRVSLVTNIVCRKNRHRL